MSFKRFLGAAGAWLLLASLLAGASQPLAQQPPVTQNATGAGDAAEAGLACGGEVITIAQFPWSSAAILARIHASLLRDGFGCSVSLVPADMGSTATRMATSGQPLIVPEMWIGQVAPVWNNGVENERVRVAGPAYVNGPTEGWYVPRYVKQANPGLVSAADLGAHWQLFVKQGGAKASFLSCPANWACSLINANLLRAYGLAPRFDVQTPENRAALDRALAGAVSAKTPIVGYYWTPNAAIVQLDLVPLDMGAFNRDAMACLAERECPDPKPSAFGPEQVAIGVAIKLQAEAPEVFAYLRRASMPIEVMNALLAWQAENGSSDEDTARHFIDSKSDLWQSWLVGAGVQAEQGG